MPFSFFLKTELSAGTSSAPRWGSLERELSFHDTDRHHHRQICNANSYPSTWTYLLIPSHQHQVTFSLALGSNMDNNWSQTKITGKTHSLPEHSQRWGWMGVNLNSNGLISFPCSEQGENFCTIQRHYDLPKGTLMTTAVCTSEEKLLQVHETTILRHSFRDRIKPASSHPTRL